MTGEDQAWAKLPKFTGKNFQVWKRQVLVVFKNKGLISKLTGSSKAVVPRSVDGQGLGAQGVDDQAREQAVNDVMSDLIDVVDKEETLAQGILFSALDDHVMGQVQTCRTAADIWKRLLLIYENSSEANIDRLLQEYYSYQKLAQDDMATHISKVEAMADQLTSLGESQSDRTIVSKILNSLSKEYDAFRNAWDSTHPSYRTKDELITRLMKLEVLGKQPTAKGSSKDVAMFVQGDKAKFKGKCHHCGMTGHFKRDCRKLKKELAQIGGRPVDGHKANNGNKGKNEKSGPSEDYGLTLVTSSVVNFGLRVSKPNEWTSSKFIVDSGASRHVTSRRDFFITYEACDLEMQAANSGTIKAIGVGTVRVLCKVGLTTRSIMLYDVLHIPDVSHNLLSVCQATSKGAKVTFYNWGCRLIARGEVIALGRTSEDSPIPVLDGEVQVNKALAIQTKRPLVDWHDSLGHPDHRVIQEMASNKCVDGLEIAKKEDIQCPVCPMGKGTRAPHTTESSFKPTRVGERVDFDLIGPMPEPSLGQARYILLTKDKFSGYSHLYVLKSKNETCDKLTEFLSHFEHDCGRRVEAVQTDNGSEFVNENVKRLFAVEHVHFETSAPYTPEQNGTAERNNRVIIETIRTLLAQGDLPAKLWAEAANTAVFLRNIIMKKGMDKTPFELFRGRRPFVGHIVPFGTHVHSLINDRRQGKFDPKTEPGVIVGFTPRMNTYRVYLPLRETVKITCDVTFKNHYLFAKDYLKLNDIVMGRPDEAMIKLDEKSQNGDGRPESQTLKPDPHLLSNFFEDVLEQHRAGCLNSHWSGSDITSPAYSEITVREANCSVCPEQVANKSESVGSVSISEPPMLSSPQSVRSGPPGRISAEPPRLLPHDTSSSSDNQERPPAPEGPPTINSLLLLAEDAPMLDEPATYQEAVTGPNSPSWQEAIDSERSAHEMNRTWRVVKRPRQGTTLTAKWVFKIKRDLDGRPKRYKARLVARGYKQKAGIDYVETFAPVAKMDSIRTLIAVAATRGWCIEQFDVSTAFLNGDIVDDLYLEPPEGIRTTNDECLKLQKALYGLKQAPRVWNSKFDQELKKLNFKPLRSDPCVYISRENNMYLVVYVDDGIIISPSRNKCLDVITALNKVFAVNRVHDNIFLGIEIVSTREGLFLSQKRYIQDVLESYRMSDCRPRTAPLNDVNSLFVRDQDVLINKPYREAIGKLLYCAMLTRPDLLFPTVLLSRFSTAPEQKHWTAILELLRYLKGTSELGLFYERISNDVLQIEVYTDADWAGNVSDRKSTSGLIITLAGCPIIFASRQQETVALSSTEAEFVASCEAVKELMWLVSFLRELNIEHAKPVVHIDNLSAIRMIKNNEMRKKTKHIDIKFHFVKDKYVEGQFELRHVETELQLADFLTKGLTGPKLATLRQMANVIGRLS